MSTSDRIEELKRRRSRAEAGGGKERIAKMHAKGKVTARERIALLSEPEQEGETQPGPGGITGEDDPAGVEPGRAQPAPRAGGVFERGRKRVFGREPVIDGEHRGPGRGR